MSERTMADRLDNAFAQCLSPVAGASIGLYISTDSRTALVVALIATLFRAIWGAPTFGRSKER